MQKMYIRIDRLKEMPRIPLEGSIDLTYRCNNNCRHCWLRIPSGAAEKKDELAFEEIKSIVGEAKKMGCRRWSISGGEPMLVPDFAEIFDYITANSASYSINTNGTFITPRIAKLMKRKGAKMVALYGSTGEIHDHVTRNPGSFDATMRGFRYLKEAAAGFMVQLIPMRDNYHQFPKMAALAKSLSKHYRMGAPWLYLSACGDRKINAEIRRQRLKPKDVVELDKPDLSYEECIERDTGRGHCNAGDRKYLFSSCVAARRDFHIDPYGKMTFCCFLKHPEFRYDLRKGNFKECWEEFIPSLAKKARITEEYKNNCGSCSLRKDCRFCPVYTYLEHGRFDAKVDYLCKTAKENRKFKENWQRGHRRYFRLADIPIQVESDLPINENTFHFKFKHFEVQGPSQDMVAIRHHFSLPDIDSKNLGAEVYRKPPWAIYKKDNSWIYLGISPTKRDKSLYCIAVFNSDHTRGRIYNDSEKIFSRGGLRSLTLFPTDQILFARILADRQGCYLHSCGVNFEGKGLLFAGHSDAGKSTMAAILKGKAKILCDDRIIIRKTLYAKRSSTGSGPLVEDPEQVSKANASKGYTLNAQHKSAFRIYGTWSHGDVPDVSGASAPLRAILFLKKSKENRVMPLNNKKEITKRLLSCVIRPLVTADWWEKTLLLIEDISSTVPCYELYFDKSGKVVELLEKL